MKTLDPETRTFDTEGSFQIILDNHGQPAHVHLHFDDDLATIASLEEPNWYVPSGGIEPVEVSIPEGVTGVGTLEVSTGYGAESSLIDVRVESTSEREAAVDTSPEPPSQPIETGASDLRWGLVPGLFAVIGVLFAVVIILFVEEWVAVALGLLVLLVAIAIAGYLLVAE